MDFEISDEFLDFDFDKLFNDSSFFDMDDYDGAADPSPDSQGALNINPSSTESVSNERILHVGPCQLEDGLQLDPLELNLVKIKHWSGYGEGSSNVHETLERHTQTKGSAHFSKYFDISQNSDSMLMVSDEHFDDTSPVPILDPLLHYQKAVAPQKEGLHEDGACTVLLRGLPSNTTEHELRSLLAWSDEYMGGTIISDGENNGHFPCSIARLLFTTLAGAEKAKDILHGKQNINMDATMEIRIIQTSTPSQIVPNSTKSKRHKFSPEHKQYLEREYSENAYPSNDDRVRFAEYLGVSEKRVQTWFNNTRQRQRQRKEIVTVPCLTPVTNIPLTRRSLEKLANGQSSSKSPIERFAAVPPGTGGEPSIDLIKAAIKERLEMGQVQAGLAWSSSNDSSVQDDRRLVDVKYPGPKEVHRPRSQYSVGEGSRSSYSNSSAFSSGSNYSFSNDRYRRENKLGKRKVRRRPSQKPAPSLGPRLSVTLQFECISCPEIFEKTIANGQLTQSMVNCPKCETFNASFNPADLCDAVALPKTITIRCGKCFRNAGVRIESQDLLEKKIERAEPGRSEIRYDCPTCHFKAFGVVVQKRPEYGCTFCPRKFRSKYVWKRHELTYHEPNIAWICCRTLAKSSTWSEHCIFCNEFLGTSQLLAAHQAHKAQECIGQSLSHRIFFRKDQLAQHVHHFHKSIFSSTMAEQWRFEIDQSGRKWQCGVCELQFDNWNNRVSHIALHWDSGLTMKSWKNKMDNTERTKIYMACPMEKLQEWRKEYTQKRLTDRIKVLEPPKQALRIIRLAAERRDGGAKSHACSLGNDKILSFGRSVPQA